MTVTVGPHRDIKTGALVSDGRPTSTKPSNGLSHPNVEVVQADKESIQDYVAQLFIAAPHTNLTVNYDDENNQLSFSVDIDGAALGGITPRIEALEENTDGLVNNADPLSYYILAKGT